ncbi:MAG TPA: protein phosphatase 2C domain-containing protein [Longimicrobiaceae bacterium]|nr:protein phosphatase 2C domain-containing protein [Longimicrobium sp.]
MRIAWEVAGGSDVGRLRKGNEDTLRIDADRGIFLVADGMGGHAAGEIASDLAARVMEDALVAAVDAGVGAEGLQETLRVAFQHAYAAIVSRCRDSPHTRGMGTTLTVCLLEPSGLARVGHIGDSRLYRLRGGVLDQITHDHTWVQREVDAGRLSADAARTHPLSHIVTRVLSEDIEPEMDLLAASVAPGDLLLLATDGLYNMVSDATIADTLSRDRPLPELTNTLIDAANAGGGVDNVTVVVIRILPAPDSPE